MTFTELKTFLADLARPWVLWAGGGSASVATVMCAWEPTLEGAAVVAAAWGGLFGIYWGKAQETTKIAIATAQASADVEKERAKGNPPPDKALEPAAEPPAPERSLEDPA
jgi:hypothetical protein